MYKNFIFIALILFMAAGCEKAAEPVTNNLTRVNRSGTVQIVDTKGEPVLLVSGQQITSDNMLNEPAPLGNIFLKPAEYLEPVAQSLTFDQFKEKIREPLQAILSDKIFDVLLYNSAKKKFGDKIDESLEKAIDSEIRRYIQQFGGDQAKADQAIREKYHDQDSLKKELKREILTQWYVSSQTNEKSFVPYRQLVMQYEKMKDDHFAINPMIKFRSIDIIPGKLEITDPNVDQKKYAQTLANELYEKLQSGADFAELAKKYSGGHRKEYGGLWDPVNPNSLAEPFNAIANATQDMKQGEISKPIITDTFIFIVKLEDKVSAGYIPFENVQEQVKNAAIVEQNRSIALKPMKDIVVQQMSGSETNAFIDFCLEKLYKISTQK